MGRTRSGLLVTTGATAGLLSGLLGMDGGVIVVPALTSRRMGVPRATASGTSLAAVVPIAALGMAAYTGYGSVDAGAALGLTVGALVGAPAGARLASRVPEVALRVTFCVLLVMTSLLLLVPLRDAVRPSAIFEPAGNVALGVLTFAGLVALGLGSGLVSGLLGSGGGTIMVPLLVIAFGFPQQLAQGTALLVVLPTCAAGIVQHRRQGTLDFPAAWRLGLGGALTVGVGAVLAAAHAPTMLLQYGLAGNLLLTAVTALGGLRRGVSRRQPVTPLRPTILEAAP
jgi:uncharacterized membrane protein YfcA